MYRLIDEYEGPLCHSQLFRICKVSASGFYDWKSRDLSLRALENKRLMVQIRAIFAKSRQTYGSIKIMRALRDQGVYVSKNRVARLMKACGLMSVHRKKYRVCTTDSKHDHPIADNVIARDFLAKGPNKKWVGDITYVKTGEGFLYVATIMDLYSRKIIGFATSQTLHATLCEDALNMALHLRNPPKEMIHHSDRGKQYASVSYQKLLKDRKHTISMSRKGNCWDNAVMESFFSLLKKECVYRKSYKTRKEARIDIEDYIFNFYNQVRSHSSLDFVSPVQYEMRAA